MLQDDNSGVPGPERRECTVLQPVRASRRWK